MYPLVEPRQRPERFLLNRFSPLAESPLLLGLGGFDAAGSVWYPDATRLLGGVPNDGTLTGMDPETAWSRDLGRAVTDHDGTDGYILAPPPVATTPLTIAGWIRMDSAPTISQIGGVFATATAYYHSLGIRGGAMEARSFEGSSKISGAGSGLTTGAWYHGAGVFRSSTYRMAYLNGVSGTANTAASAPSGFDECLIGKFGGATPYYVNGKLADVCFWNRELSDAEISALADPSNVMLSVGGVPLILPPHRVSFPAAVAEGGDIIETASPVSATWSVVVPATSKSITPDVVSATFTAVTPATAKTIAPAAVSATWSPVAPATSKTVAVSPASASWSIPTPLAGSSFIAVDVDPVSATWSPVAPATAKTTTPDPVSATWTPAAPTTAKMLAVDPVALTWSIVAAELLKTTTPDPVAAAWLLPDVTTAGGAGTAVAVNPVVATWTVAVARGGVKPVIDSANVLRVQSESRVLRVQSESRVLQVQ